MREHVHVHAPHEPHQLHELHELHEASEAVSSRERVFETVAVRLVYGLVRLALMPTY